MKAFNGRLVVRRDGPIVVVGPKRAYKLALRRVLRQRLAMELAGNRQACADPFWRDAVLPVRGGPFGLIMPAGDPVDERDPRVDQCLATRLQALETAPRDRADRLVATAILDHLAVAEDDRVRRARILNQLAGFQLPRSSAHGDFHHGNLLARDGQLAIIDWGCYRRVSSFLLDAVHYRIRYWCLQRRRSWVDVAYGDQWAAADMRRLAERFEVRPDQLVAAYAVNRASLETAQYLPALREPPRAVSVKHRAVIERVDDDLR
jgi:hypothetical protein